MEGLFLVLAILLAILVTVGIILVIVIWKRPKTSRFKGSNFHTFYVMGLVFIPFGIVSMAVYSRLGMPFFFGVPFLAMGITYLIVGLLNKDKWNNAD
jgi:hypothetical protein